MKHAFIMDPLAGVRAYKDTSYFLMLACVQRGHRVCHIDQRDLWLQHDEPRASVQWLDVHSDTQNPFTLLVREDISLSDIDVVWVRTDPPFDRRYFYTTLLLDYLPASTRVINRPDGIRNWNEKLAALHYASFTPATRVTSNPDAIREMADSFGRIAIKPVDGFGGKGIVFFAAGDDVDTLRQITHDGRHWVICQQYLDAAKEGDKRILLLDGEPLGGILRVHAAGAELNNMDAGGTAKPCQLDDRDYEICSAIKPGLIAQGIFFAGIDVIGGMLIEINVTSPTGLQEMSRFDGTAYHHRIIQILEL